LTAREAARMTEAAASRLRELLDGGIPAADITEAVTDAAVVFLLTMRKHGVLDPKWIPACTVMWNGEAAEERVFFGA
jgi:ornithine cyclodeaminase/alanine dehydrogenase-like protein (mu-crystallin family)